MAENEQSVARATENVKKAIVKKPSVKKPRTQTTHTRKSKNTKNQLSSNKLEVLITIVNRKKADFFMDLIQSFEVNMQFLALGEGTAGVEMLSLLGLADSDKAVIFSVIKEEQTTPALRALDEKFHTIKDGKGIAFTVSLSSVIGVSIFGFLSNNKMTVKEEK